MASRWHAKLDLGFSHRNGHTWVDTQAHEGPLRIQRAFYPEGTDAPHVYVLHPPGGVVAGDHLSIRCRTRAGAHALVTTPGAAKFYRSRQPDAELSSAASDVETSVAEQLQHLRVAAGSTLEWLPQETIAFDGARAKLKTRIELEPGAQLAAWDILCLGRPGSAESYRRGSLSQRLEIVSDGSPLLLERAAYDGGSAILDQRWGLGGHPVSGTFVWVSSQLEGGEARRSGGAEDELLGEVRDSMAKIGRGWQLEAEQISASWLRTCLVCRYLGSSTERAKQVFTAAWQVLRPHLFERPACPPRIWQT